jgi:hypothetical protein
MSENGENYYSIETSVGDLSVEVSGNDPDWVAEKFEETWSKRLDEANGMKKAIRKADRSTQ